MPSFETQYEQDKWDRLARLADKTMRKAKAGTADAEDVELVSAIMKEFGGTVASTIESTAKAVRKTAKMQTQQANEERKRKGKKPYDKVQFKIEYNKKVKDLLDLQAIEIVLAVEEILKEEFAKLGIQLDDLATDIKDHVTNESDSTKDEVHIAKDEVLERIEKLEEFQYDMFEALMDSCCPEDKKQVQSKQQREDKEQERFVQQQDNESPEQLVNRLLGSSQEEEFDFLDSIINDHIDDLEEDLADVIEEETDTFTNHLNSLIGGAETAIIEQLQDDSIDALGPVIEQLLSEEEDAEPDEFTEHVERLLGNDRESVEKRSENLSDELSDLNDILEDLGYKENKSRNQSDKDESRKADTWIRALSRSWLGKKTRDAYNSGASIGMALLKAAGAVLVTSLMGGKLWEHIKDYLSVEQLKEYGTEFYNYLSTKTRQLLSYITSKLLPDSNPDDPDSFTTANVSNSVMNAGSSTSSTYVSGVVTPAPQAPYDPVHIAKQKDVYLPGSEPLQHQPSASLPSSQGAIVNPSNTEVSFGGYKHDLTSVVSNSPVMNRSSFTLSPILSEVQNNPVDFNQRIINQGSSASASSSSVTHMPISVQKATILNPDFTPSVVHTPEVKGQGSNLSQMPSIFSIPNASGSPGLGLINVGLLTGS